MQEFNKKAWEEIGPRLAELRGDQDVETFLERNIKKEEDDAETTIRGLHWTAMEAGRSGMSFDSLYRLCRKKNVSPSWLLFGKGPKSMPTTREHTLTEITDHIMNVINAEIDDNDRRALKKLVHECAERISDIFYGTQEKPNVPPTPGDATRKNSPTVLPIGSSRGRKTGG